MKISDIVVEGPNDPHIFKAVFLAGGPGSGKSFVSSKLLAGTGLRVVNSDDIYEYMMTKQGMSLDPETIFSPAGQDTRERAKGITNRKQQSHINGRLGLIIDGTGKDVAKYAKTKKMLEDLGYETMMLFVNTSEDVAQERNLMRPRKLDPKVVKKMWDAVQQNIMAFQQLFGAQNFYVVDNSGGLEDPARKDNFNQVSKAISKFINSEPKRREARAWLDAQKPSAAKTTESASNEQPVTQNDLKKLEYYADKVFAKVGIDVEFTRHFLDRVNDERNVRQITLPELAVLFRDEYARWGKKIAQLGPDAEGVMKDMRSDINVPFALRWDSRNQELDLIAKTVMRKKNFKTPNQEFPVESVSESKNYTDLAQSAIDYLENLRAANSNNLGMVTSIDNRLGPIRSYLRRNNEKMLMDLLMNDDYLSPWRREINVTSESRTPNQVRGKDRAKTSKPSATGSQPHPFRGKLVGGTS